jgi:hypothetical protein
MSCEQMRDLAPEIALGIADGEERAEALRHLSECTECRRLVEQLSEIADELLMLAPVEEPPVGFESRVVDALGVREPDRRRRPGWLNPRWLAPRLGPALVAVAVTAAALIGVYRDDHQTAERYREALARADGQYFQAETLADGTGAEAGVAFGYQGSPSWLLVTVDRAHRDRVTGAELVTRNGRTIPLRSLELDRYGSWGGAVPVNLYDVASIRLLGERSGRVLTASFPGGVVEED